MAVRIGSNISSLQAQRRLSESSSFLSKVFERLSSGQRINRAADDAAGLAIADSLRTDARVLTQGTRNLNDAVSYYSVAQGASTELKNIIYRAKELAQQSANGSYSDSQRLVLDNEFQTIGNEYNRIISGSVFNGLYIFSRSANTLVSQAGTSTISTTLNSDRATSIDTISRVSLSPSGSDANGSSAMGQGSLSSDGRYSVFASSATNLVSGISGNQIYRKDLQTGQIQVISTSSSGTAGNASSSGATISVDGRYVVFASSATNLVTGLSGNQIYRKDTLTGEIQAISTDSSGVAGNNTCQSASMSADCRYVVFVSIATNLVAGVGDGIKWQIFRKDLQTNQIQAVSTSDTGTVGDQQSIGATISSDGRYAVFLSNATNLVSGVSGAQIYRKDLQTGQIQVVSSSSSGTAGNGSSTSSAVSADGRFVVFVSSSTNFVTGVSGSQLYRKDLQTGQVQLASSTKDGTAGNGTISSASLSADGRYAVFTSNSTNLVSGVGGSGRANLYIKDLETQEIRCLNLSQSGRAPTNSSAVGVYSTAISADGRYVAFYTDFKDQLDGTPTGAFSNAYVTSNPLTDPSSLTRLQWVNIKTKDEALNAMSWIDSYLDELNAFQGSLGSSMSRLDVARNVLVSMNENYLSAESRIRDADIAQESANLIRGQILQQVASAVLAQANQEPALAIQLLRAG